MSMEIADSFLKVHSVESFGTHDGPGLRLVFFLQGCNIKCKYCQNADTIAFEGGSKMSLNEMVKRAVNMKTYFDDGGGVTVSGGEPMIHSKTLIPFFKALQAEGIHTNIDTNGTIRTPDALSLISDLADLVMFDIKATSEDEFESIADFRGLKNTLENIALREASKKPYWFRYVLVPGHTDSEKQLQWIIDTFKNNQYLEKIEILPFHKLGEYKWESLGMKYQFKDVEENTPGQIEFAHKKLEPFFNRVKTK